MKKDVKSKAIETILIKHKDHIFRLIENGTPLAQLHQYIISCLDKAAATGNESVPAAKVIFNSCLKKGYNCYLSTLVAYLTGITTGEKRPE